MIIDHDALYEDLRTWIKSQQDTATRHHLPAVPFNREFPKAGGLMSCGNGISDNYRRSATFVDRILKSEKLSNLLINVPVQFELIVNLKTARHSA